MKSTISGAVAAGLLTLHAVGGVAQSPAAPALASVAVTSASASLSVEEMVRLHAAVTQLFSHPAPEALATIQELRDLLIERLDSGDAVADSVPVKKGGGLFGKVKGVAKNKVVQQVAKTAACNMLPGGQIVAGAIDAAANKDAVGAAAGAATGSTCMPGMAGAGGAGAGAIGGGALAAGALGAGAMPGAAGMPAAAMMAGGGQPSGMDPAAVMAMMQASMARMGQPGQMSVGMPGEAGGLPLEIAADLLGELRKGKTAVRRIDWVAGAPSMSPAGGAAFTEAAEAIAAAMAAAGGSYRLDLFMDERYDGTAVKMLGPQRLAVVQAALLGGGDGAGGIELGKVKRDGDPRLEIVKLK